MAVMQNDGSDAGVERWRRDQLVDAGFPRRLATSLAHEQRYDVHELITLAERGCPPALAARIAAPLDAVAEPA
jgi:hypothetical protein